MFNKCKPSKPRKPRLSSIVYRLSSIVFLCVLCVLYGSMTGCIKTISIDPNTGLATTHYAVDANVVAKAEKPVEGTITLLTVLATIWPDLIPPTILMILASIFGTWLKIKPKLTAAQTRAQIAYNASAATILGIEEFKKAAPDQWDKLCQQLEAIKAKIIKPEDALIIENFIRGLRGLPPKE